MLPLASYLEGLTLGLGLIIAIGPKDAYVIRQSLEGRYLGTMMTICVGSDVVLITIGILGFGTLVSSSYELMFATLVGGSTYMAVYGVLALRAATMNTVAPGLEDSHFRTIGQVARTATALSFLNPLALLDSAILLGALSGTKPPAERLAFALGAMTASIIWFSVLIGGSRALAPLFRRATTWRVLDASIAAIMFVMAALTLRSAFLLTQT